MLNCEVVLQGPNRFPELAERFPEVVSEFVGKVTFQLHGELYDTSPFLTGHLQKTHVPRFRAGSHEGEVYIGASYAGYVARRRSWVEDGVANAQRELNSAFAALESAL